MPIDAANLNSVLDGVKTRLSDIAGDAAEVEVELAKIYASKEDLQSVGTELDSLKDKAEAVDQALDTFSEQGHVQSTESGDLVKEDGIFSDGT